MSGSKGADFDFNTTQARAASGAQSEANRRALGDFQQFSQITETNPFASRFFTGEIGSDERTAQTAFSPELQSLFAGLSSFGSEALPIGGTVLDLSELPGISNSGDFLAAAAPVEQATFDRAANLLSPQFDLQERRLRNQLTQQGIDPELGAAAATGEFGALTSFRRDRDRAFNDLALGSVQAGRDEQSRLFGLESADRNRALQEALLQRSVPLGEVGFALQGLQGLGALSQFQPIAVQGTSPVDVTGVDSLRLQSQLQRQAQGQAFTTNLLNQGAQIVGGAAGIVSSREFKDDLGPAKSFLEGIRKMPIRQWRYTHPALDDGRMHIGPCAEHFQQVFGLGDGTKIPIVDAIGVLFAGLQELAEERA